MSAPKSRTPITKNRAGGPRIVIFRKSIIAEVDSPDAAFGSISAWWNGPTVEGKAVTETLSWEADDHVFELTITPNAQEQDNLRWRDEVIG